MTASTATVAGATTDPASAYPSFGEAMKVWARVAALSFGGLLFAHVEQRI